MGFSAQRDTKMTDKPPRRLFPPSPVRCDGKMVRWWKRWCQISSRGRNFLEFNSLNVINSALGLHFYIKF